MTRMTDKKMPTDRPQAAEARNSGEAPEVMVSVIMITYNQEATIDAAIRSVVSQRAPFGFELIVADDASTDSTPDRIRKWAAEWPGKILSVRRPRNLGLQRNFMEAFGLARGRYIAICEGDDWWCSPKKLRRQAEYMEAHPECNVCFHRVVNYYEDDHTLSLSNGATPSDMDIVGLARANVITNLSVMYRRNPALSPLPEWIAGLRLFDYALHMLHAGTGRIHYMAAPMAVYRQRHQGIWSGGAKATQLKMAMDTRIELIDYFRGLERETPSEKLYAGAIAGLTDALTEIALALLLEYSRTGASREAVMELRELIGRYNPEMRGESLTRALEGRLRREEAAKARPNLLSRLRAIVSRLIPPPRIRRGAPIP